MQGQDTKFCKGCGETKPLAEFQRQSRPNRHKPRSRCKRCCSKKRSEWYHRQDKVSEHLCECGCGEYTLLSFTTENYRQPNRFLRGHDRRIEWRDRYHIEDCGYETPCWIWNGSENGHGYGQISGAKGAAHRAFYVDAHGSISDGLHLDHLCRVPKCVNPDHLEPVTVAVNVQRGGAAKLTAEQVREIRRRAGERTRDLAKEFGVGEQTISAIKHNRTWVDV